jgi:acylphosphatase
MSGKNVRLVITGRVQGVGYRYFVLGEAEARNLAGWVRNRRDGAVEISVSGPAELVDELIAACWRGPRASRVADVQVESVDLAPSAAGFTIWPSV